jgi:hypothetical protein
MDETDRIQWRRDADTSRTVRLLWAGGVGTFFAVSMIVVFWRLFDLASQAGNFAGGVVAAALALVLVTAFAFAVSDTVGRQLGQLAQRLSVSVPSGPGLNRARDAALGTVAMTAIIGGLMIAGRLVSQYELFDFGAGPFTALAALSLPLALIALVLSSFLRSVGTYDRTERMIHLHDPDQSIDLRTIRSVSIREVGDVAVVKLDYAQPGGQYVPGPRRIVLPPGIATEIARGVNS